MSAEQYPSPESEETPSTFEALLVVAELGYHAFRFWKEKKDHLADVTQEAKEDVRKNPWHICDIVTGAVASVVGTGLEYVREEKEKATSIQGKKLSGLHKVIAERDRISLLGEFGEIQEEAIEDALGDILSEEEYVFSDEERERLEDELKSETVREGVRQAILQYIRDIVEGAK